MELKEFCQLAIDSADKAYTRKNHSEAIRLLNTAKKAIEEAVENIEKEVIKGIIENA